MQTEQPKTISYILRWVIEQSTKHREKEREREMKRDGTREREKEREASFYRSAIAVEARPINLSC